jgi:hypothetical protein
VDGPLLVLEGPKTAGAIARRLLERKPEILALLTSSCAFPWPEVLPDLSRRRVAAFAPCTGGPGGVGCGNGTFVYYGDTPVCLGGALSAVVGANAPETTPEALLDGMLEMGASFQLLEEEAGEEVLLWFGPAATVTDELRAEVARLKPEIIRLFSEGYPRSRRAWGRPSAW